MRLNLKYFLFIVPALVLAMTLLGSSAGRISADAGPHSNDGDMTTDRCAGCHRAHRGQAELLLKTSSVESLCFSCHGNSAIGSSLNVANGTDEDNAAIGALRGGGFLTARINVSDPSKSADFPSASGPPEVGDQCLNAIDDDADGVINDGCPSRIGVLAAGAGTTVYSKHQTNGSAQTVWGYGLVNAAPDAGMAAFDLSCASCHDPHGNGNYRILRTVPEGLPYTGTNNHGTLSPVPAGYPKLWNDADNDGIMDAGETVYLADESPKQYFTKDYFTSGLRYSDFWYDGDPATSTLGTTDHLVPTEATGRMVGRWCTTCHTRYLTAAGNYDYDSGDAIFKYKHTTDAGWPSSEPGSVGKTRVKENATSTGTQATVASCLQCHVSHGSNAQTTGAAADVEFPGAPISVPAGDTAAYTKVGGPAPGGDNESSALLRMTNRGICKKCHNI